MADRTEPVVSTVALIGNPNTGKSTLFSALVGIYQHVGNYPGATVEKKTGRMDYADRRYEFIDLPGLYSLAARSRDEMVAADVLLGRREDCEPVDAVVCIVDAANLRRNLYLVSQVLELGLPTLVAVNMLDVAEKHDVAVDLERLRQQLPVPVVGIQANRRIGIDDLKAAFAELIEQPPHQPETPFPEAFEKEVTRLESLLGEQAGQAGQAGQVPRSLVRRLLLDRGSLLQRSLLEGRSTTIAAELEAARDRLTAADLPVPEVETKVRYAWARRVLDGVVTQPDRYKRTTTDRIDRVLTHRVWGLIVFFLLMGFVFQTVFTGGSHLMDLIGAVFQALGGLVETQMAEGALRSLLVDGVIGGVGGVVTFLPQILILFLFIALLEDCGYMARAAYLMDKLMSRVGLSGKSFIPMLSSFACAIPGIMAARVIENERDRLTTILVAPLMTCSARLPIFSLLIAAFIPAQTVCGRFVTLQGITLLSLYLLGIVSAVGVALLLKKTLLRGATPPFVMELPSYKWPSPRTVLHRVGQRGWIFLRTAGTLILAVSILVWAAIYFPHNSQVVEAPFRARQQASETELARLDPDDTRHAEVSEELAQINREIAGAYQRQSILGQMGRVIEPAVKPLGWDWRIGCAVIASLPAREVVVATLGVIYNLGEDVDAESEEGRTKFHRRLNGATWDGSDPPRKVFNVPVALSIMVFFALCAQCFATLAVIRRETNSWRWPAFTFAYMTTLAYLGALATYQIGIRIGG
ncbi:MAG: ferrous iron transport protein B [Candidatus Nealsonbacteria bacterium]|nr:ferrous iron transport protein B [Candidatus Nealsonbacteria bacterium]